MAPSVVAEGTRMRALRATLVLAGLALFSWVAQPAIAESIRRTVPAAAGEAIAVNGSSMTAYVANAAANRVAVVDQTGATTYVPVGRNPRYIAVDAPNYTAYVSNTGDASLSVIRKGALTATTLPINGAGPIAIDSTRNRIYVLRQGNNGEVTVVDGKTLSWYAIDTGSHTPVDLALNAATQRLYVSHNLSGDVRAIDLTSPSDHPPSVSIQIAGHPGPLAYNSANNRIYVLSDDARGPIVAIDGDTHATQRIPLAGFAYGTPRAIAANARTNQVYAGFSSGVVVIDGNTHNLTFVATADVLSIATDGQSGNAYVLDAARNLTVIDGYTDASRSIHVGAEASAVAYIYKLNAAYVAGSVLNVVDSPGTDMPPGGINAQGLWWSLNGAESGWGINLAHQGNIVFATWFTYDSAGRGMWLVMPNGQQVGRNSYEGPLYRTTGPAFNAVPFDPVRVAKTAVGTARIDIANANNATLTATVDGVPIRRALSKQVFAFPAPICAAASGPGETSSFQDLWWNSPAGSESGWGLNITHQGDILFVTWFTYAADGQGMWLVGSRVERAGNGAYRGTLYRTAGPPIGSSPWDPKRVTPTVVGSIALTFTDADNATLAYTVDGISGAKSVTRQAFATPPTVCR
jgi:DNA-binding beta-propeller fold protein YncE